MGKMRQLRRLRGDRLLLTGSAADLCYVVPDHPGRQSAAIITKGLGILKFLTTTGPQILSAKRFFFNRPRRNLPNIINTHEQVGIIKGMGRSSYLDLKKVTHCGEL